MKAERGKGKGNRKEERWKIIEARGIMGSEREIEDTDSNVIVVCDRKKKGIISLARMFSLCKIQFLIQ